MASESQFLSASPGFLRHFQRSPAAQLLKCSLTLKVHKKGQNPNYNFTAGVTTAVVHE